MNSSFTQTDFMNRESCSAAVSSMCVLTLRRCFQSSSILIEYCVRKQINTPDLFTCIIWWFGEKGRKVAVSYATIPVLLLM